MTHLLGQSVHWCQQNRVTAQEPQAHISIRNLIISHFFFAHNTRKTKYIYEGTQAGKLQGSKIGSSTQHDHENCITHHFRIFPIFCNLRGNTQGGQKFLGKNLWFVEWLVEHAMILDIPKHKHDFYSFLMVLTYTTRMVYLVNPIYDYSLLIWSESQTVFN